MQKILSEGKLLDENGHLIEAGYALSLVKEYDREAIKASKLKIKEWDYYLIANDRYAVAFTIADNSYMSLISASFIDFTLPKFKTTSVMKWFSFGKRALPKTSKVGDVEYSDKRLSLSFLNDGRNRRIKCQFNKFNSQGETLFADFTLGEEPRESMVIATPFKENDKAFYYNQKINCIKAVGQVSIGETVYLFKQEDTLAVLDWGRGVWTYDNTWYWGSMSTYVDGVAVGFNIGYGFGDASSASENMIFYDGKAHKTEQVTFNIPTSNGKDDFMSNWTFTSSDNRINLKFKPIIDRADITDVGLIASYQHQVFGKFTGTLVLDDGKIINLVDCLGFAEKVRNKW